MNVRGRGRKAIPNFLQNLRFSLRMLRKSPGFATTVILTLMLGIGATTAIYTVVYATLIADMPYPKPHEVVMVWSTIHGHRTRVSAADYLAWKQQSTSFSGLYASATATMNLGGVEDPEVLNASIESPGYYANRGVPFMMGRDFVPDEATQGKGRVVILSNRLWRRLGADRKILGKSLRLDQKAYTVVGVLAAGQPDNYPWDLTVPLILTPQEISNRDAHWLDVGGRLKDGVTMQQANGEMAAIANRIAQANPRSNHGWGARVESLKDDWLTESFKRTLWLFLGASGFVLLIACLNIANLLLAKGMTRQREIAIRTAVGATRRGVFIQFIMESLLLALIGGALGVGLGYALLRGIIAVMPYNTLPGEAVLKLSLPVLLVTLAATTFAGLFFGGAPAWYASRVDPAEFLKEGGRAGSSRLHHRLRQLLVMGEFAVALSLLAGAGMAIHSFWNLYHIDLGVRTDNVLTFILPVRRAGITPEQSAVYYQQMVQRIQAVPGVRSASVSTGLPLEGSFFRVPFTIAGQADFANPSQRPITELATVTPSYFKTFGIRLMKGRLLTRADDATSMHVAVVNEEFVRHSMAGEDPIGQTVNLPRITPQSTAAARGSAPFEPWVIVGVIHDVHGGMFEAQPEEVDVPFYQEPYPIAAVGVHTAGDPEILQKSISRAVHSLDPSVPLSQLATLDEIRDKQLVGQRFSLSLYVSFAVLALVLAAVGIYGVLAFSIRQREHEIGVRMALGAGRDRVVRMVLREAAVLAGVGSLLGLAGAFFVGRAIQTTLYGVGKVDLKTFGAVAALLFIVALVASYFPARRASSVDPVKALRAD